MDQVYLFLVTALFYLLLAEYVTATLGQHISMLWGLTQRLERLGLVLT